MQVCLGLVTMKGTTNATSFEGMCSWHANVHQSCLQCRVREFGSKSSRPHNRSSHVTTAAQDCHIMCLHLRDCLRSATQIAQKPSQTSSAESFLALQVSYIVLTNLTGQMFTFDGVLVFGECSLQITDTL